MKHYKCDKCKDTGVYETNIHGADVECICEHEDAEWNYSKITNIQFADVHRWDFPDFSDAHIVAADYYGQTMSEEQIEMLNEESDFVYEKLMNHIF